MRKVAIGIGVLVLLIIGIVLISPKFIDVNHYRPQIETKLREHLGRDVSLGPMRVSLLPLAFRVENATIGEDVGYGSGRPFAQVQTLFVSPKLLPLLHRQVEIKSLQLDRPSIELVRNEKGVWNFSTLVHDKDTQKPSSLSLDRLKIYDGQIAITDRQQRKPRAVYDHIDLVLTDYSTDKPFEVDMRAHLPGSGQQILALQGRLGPVDRVTVANTPFDGKLKLDAVSLSSLRQSTNAAALANSEAILTGNAALKNSSGGVSSTGKFEVQNPRIRGVDVGYPITIDYDVNGNPNESAMTIQKAKIRLGQTPVSFQGKINAQPAPAQVDVTVQASNASIAEAARLAAAFGIVFNAKTNVTGNLNMNVHAQGPTTKPALSGQVSARDLRISGGELAEPVQVDAIEMALSPDAVRSNEFTAKTGRTSVAAQFTLTGYASDAPKVEAKLNTGNAQMEELLRIARAYGISAVDGINGSGVVTLSVSASGPIKQSNQLTYSGTGAIRNTSLTVPSMTKPLAVRNADLQFNGAGVDLNNLDVSLGQTTAHGSIVARNLSAPQLQFSISANHINVAEWEQLFKSSGPKRTEPGQKSVVTKPASEDSLITRMTGSGSLTADKIVYDDLTLNNVRATVGLDHGIITMKPLGANLYNGQQAGTVVVNTRTTPVTYTIDSRLTGVDANQLLSSISPVKQTLYGILSANADTHFTTAAGAHSILPSLNGKISLNLKDGKVANVDLLHQLATIAQFQRTARAVEPFTQLVQLTGDFDINNGVARTNNLKAIIDAGSLAARGTVDLAQQKLNLHLTAVLSQEYSQSVGGTNIGGFLNTALANNKGELVIPVLVTGTFQEPLFAPDLEQVARMKLENLVPDISNPAGFTKGILGEIFKSRPEAGEPPASEKPSPQNPTPQNPDQKRPEDNFKDLLDIFKNRK